MDRSDVPCMGYINEPSVANEANNSIQELRNTIVSEAEHMSGREMTNST